jgi:hypothetical protein
MYFVIRTSHWVKERDRQCVNIKVCEEEEDRVIAANWSQFEAQSSRNRIGLYVFREDDDELWGHRSVTAYTL